MNKILSKLILDTDSLRFIYQPQFFYLNTDEDRITFQQFLQTPVFVCDDLYNQLKELIRSRHPAENLLPEDYAHLIGQHLGSCTLDDYGAWVYYPWSKRLVHLLPEEEFIELRTSRNKYKITDAEENSLNKKKVGVVGLSVGQSVSLVLSMERSIGELRIADFDTLELSNLNRIRSGVHNLGLHKTIMVAREIAEIDPYLKVVPFTDGLSHENMDRFFTGGGLLDVVIDECDGLDIKIFLRHKAKSLNIPVLMEASDRGMLDVERFDLEPERPLLHGFIDHLDASKIGELTNEEKIPFLLPMLGAETISTRLKASMLEVSQSITTWPQLASAVALGGAITADVCRRVLLNQFHDSGRYFIDVETLVADKDKKDEGTYEFKDELVPPLTRHQMIEAAEKIPLPGSIATNEQLQIIAAAGASAPSAGNNQPWKFLSHKGALLLFHDAQKSVSWFNFEDAIANISFGAAIENIAIKAATIGLEACINLFPPGADLALVAVITFKECTSKELHYPALAQYIGSRCTNRKKGNSAAIAAGQIDELKNLAGNTAEPKLSFSVKSGQIQEIANIVGIAERIRFLHPQTHHEFFSQELKWHGKNDHEITEGLDHTTLELTEAEATGLQVASAPGVIATLNSWRQGKGFEKLSRKAIITSGGIGLISVPSFSAENMIAGGRLLERIWLRATQFGLALHPVSAPLFLHNKVHYDRAHGLNNTTVTEINSIYSSLCNIFPALNDETGVFLFRLSHADAPSARSLKQPLRTVFYEY